MIIARRTLWMAPRGPQILYLHPRVPWVPGLDTRPAPENPGEGFVRCGPFLRFIMKMTCFVRSTGCTPKPGCIFLG